MLGLVIPISLIGKYKNCKEVDLTKCISIQEIGLTDMKVGVRKVERDRTGS